MNDLISNKEIISQIFFIRGTKVMLDTDLAMLYDVNTKVLNQAVKRNTDRFPEDFMFQLTETEYENLRSHIVTLETGKGKHRKYLPYAFTEQGVAMLSGILRSKKAILVNIAIMRAFVKMRELIDENEELKKKLDLLEAKYDKQFHIVFEAMKQLVQKENEPREPVGFKIKKK